MFNKILEKYKELSSQNRNIIVNMIGAFVIKGFALIVSLFTTPAYIEFFNNDEALGLWFTILSVLSWILNFDLGIGNGLRNHLTNALSMRNDIDAKKFISSAYISVGVLCLCTWFVFLFFYDYIDWNAIFNIDTKAISVQSLSIAVKIVFGGIMLQLFLKLISSILYALQKSSVNNFLALCTSIITLIMVKLLPSTTNDHNLIIMALIHSFAVVFPLIVVSIIIFSQRKMRRMIPSVKFFSIEHAKKVLSLGGMFFLVQIVYMLIMSTNEYIITLFCGSEFVVEYKIYHQIFMLGSTVFTLALTPIWSSVTKAIAENKYIWVEHLYNKLLLLASGGILCESLLMLFVQPFVKIWLAEEAITINYFYAFCFAALAGFMILNSVLSSITNGLSELRTQAIFFSIGAIIKVPIAILFINVLNSWIGVVIANICSILPYCIIQPIYLKKYLKNKKY